MLSLDAITLGVPDVSAALEFYTTVYRPSSNGQVPEVRLDMHGTGHIGLHGADTMAAEARVKATTSGFRGYILSYIVSQPSEVVALLDAAVQRGASVLKPAKKSLFGGFSAAYQAPDGSIWKLSAASKKDKGAAGDPPIPTETAVLLGVNDPNVSKAFYVALGMKVDRDYGNKYIDFAPAPGTGRLGLMQRPVLAKDVGVKADGDGFRRLVFYHQAKSRTEVDTIFKAVVTAGGQIVVAARETELGRYAGLFSDPDGFVWKVSSASR